MDECTYLHIVSTLSSFYYVLTYQHYIAILYKLANRFIDISIKPFEDQIEPNMYNMY